MFNSRTCCGDGYDKVCGCSVFLLALIFMGGISRVPARSWQRAPRRLGLLGEASRAKRLPPSQGAQCFHLAPRIWFRQTFKEKRTLPETRAHVSEPTKRCREFFKVRETFNSLSNLKYHPLKTLVRNVSRIPFLWCFRKSYSQNRSHTDPQSILYTPFSRLSSPRLGSPHSSTNTVRSKPFLASALKFPTLIIATTTKICTRESSRLDHSNPSKLV